MPALCCGTRWDLALLSALGCGTGATAMPGRPGALGHALATLPQAVLTSSPALPAVAHQRCSFITYFLLFFFPLFIFFCGWGGGRKGREDQSVNVDVG